MNSERDLGALLDLVAREAARLLDAERASIFLLDRDKSEMSSKVALGSDEILRFDARLGVAGAAALSGQTINVDDAYNDSRFHTGIDARTGYRTRNLLAVPLRNYEGEVTGSFEALNKKRGRFSEEEEQILKSLAAHIAIAVETAQLVKEGLKLSPEALRRLTESSWPGNVRQLQNDVKRLAVCARRKVITEEDLLEGVSGREEAGRASTPARSLQSAVEDLEKRMILEAYQVCGRNQQQAAKALGLSRQGLINKMKRYGIQ